MTDIDHNSENGYYAVSARGDLHQTLVTRLVDLIVASLVLVLATPVLTVAAAAIKATDGGPIVHRRKVLGRGGSEFNAFKLRTMRVDADIWLASQATLQNQYNDTLKLRVDPRVTPVGRLLRRFSIDELPQMVNVIVGQMSIVGPRMIHPPELERFGHLAEEILTVKPGITGLWQVSGRQDLTFEDRLALDEQYLRYHSLSGDLRIILRTIPAIVGGRGAY